MNRSDHNSNQNTLDTNSFLFPFKEYHNIFKLFLKDIFSKMNFHENSHDISFSSFHAFMRLPSIISGQLFCSLQRDKNKGITYCLSEADFVSGLFVLYEGSIEKRIELIFNFFCAKGKNLVEMNDIFLILSHFHFYNSKSAITEFTDLFQDSLKLADVDVEEYFSEPDFFSLVTAKNSDFFLLCLNYFIKFCPFQPECLEKYCEFKYGKNGEKYTGEIGINEEFPRENIFSRIAIPSHEMVYYFNTNFNNEARSFHKFEELPSTSEDEELEVLDSFSGDVKREIQKFITNPPNFSHPKFHMKKEFNCYAKIYNSRIDQKSDSHIFSSYKAFRESSHNHNTIHNNNPSHCKFSSHKVLIDVSSNFCISNSSNEIIVFQLNQSTEKLFKCKLIYHMTNLFYLKFSSETRTFHFKGLYILHHTYIQICQKEIHQGKSFSCFKFLSNDNSINEDSFLCEKEYEMMGFIKNLRKEMNYRSFHDYFELREKIGSGQFGNIFKAIQKSSGTEVSVKVIRKKGKESERELEIFYFLNSTNHPHILKAVDYFETISSLFLVYEYISGETLLKLIPKLNEAQKEKIIIELIDAIGYLHRYGVIHRDIKPANIMCTYSEESETYSVKLIDFGFAKVVGKSERIIERCGTLMFLAPEILYESQISYSNKVDVWSFGVTVLSLILENLSIDISQISEEMISMLVDKVRSMKIWKKYLKIIEMCLKISPEERGTIDELLLEYNNIMK